MNITASIVTQKSNNLKRQICIHILFTSSFLFPLELFLIQLLKTISSFIFNFHSRFHKIDKNQFHLIYCRYQFHWYHYHPVDVDPLTWDPQHTLMYVSWCMMIPLPRILTYIKCMLVMVIHLSGILYTQCILVYTL